MNTSAELEIETIRKCQEALSRVDKAAFDRIIYWVCSHRESHEANLRDGGILAKTSGKCILPEEVGAIPTHSTSKKEASIKE